MRFNDSVFGVALIVFALAEIAYTTTFDGLYGQDYGPDLFPVIIGMGMIGFGGILLARGWSERRTVPLLAVGAWAEDRRNVVNVAALIGAILFYILVSDWLGFVPSSLLILTVLLVRLGTGLGPSLLIAAVTTFAIQLLFAKVLLVPLPWGLLLPVAW